MLLQDFKYEDKSRKKQLLFENGVYLAVRYTKEHHILLFAVGAFYAELYFDFEEQQIGHIRAFTNVNELAPYLNSIDISGIFLKQKMQKA